MALNDIIFVKGQGGLGCPLEGEDYISGLLFYGTAPAGWPLFKVKLVGSVEEAENAGILNTYADGTASTGTVTITAVGADGDTINVKVVAIDESANTATYDLGTYTKVTADSTVTLVATAIKNIINAGTYSHGFSATNASGAITITAPKRFGTYLNTSVSPTVTIVGTATATTAAFASGTVSKQAVWHYHISKFLEYNQKAVCTLAFGQVQQVLPKYRKCKTLPTVKYVNWAYLKTVRTAQAIQQPFKVFATR